MKRLFIIGNGFDLAHNIPTSYNDLMNWYGRTVIERLQERQTYEDDFFNASLKTPIGNFRGRNTSYNIHECPQEFSTLLKKGLAKSKSDLFSELLDSYTNKNWVDIESYYFDKLKKIANPKIDIHTKIEKVNSLNQQFSEIQNLLHNYLGSLKKEVETIPEFIKIFDRAIPTLFLNFNYTNTLQPYLKKLNHRKNISIVNIHGELNKNENPVIFGYGDQHDEVYPILENLNFNSFLDFIEYPKYTLSDGFQRLNRFINSSYQYEVNIIGHSCGLSDRTLFREILEKENCNKIYIHHFPDRDDFSKKTTELTRHFENKISHIKKIQPFDPKLVCPQLDAK